MPKSINLLAITVSIVLIISSITLWLFETELKFYFYLFEVLLIISLILCLGNSKIRYFQQRRSKRNVNFHFVGGLVQMFLATFILISPIFPDFLKVLTLPVTMLLGSLLTGYILIAILGIEPNLSRLELLPLSFIIGFTFSSFLFLPIVFVNNPQRTLIMPLFYFVLGFLAVIKSTLFTPKNKIRVREKSFSQLKDVFPLVILLISYAFFYIAIYPGASFSMGSDQSNHYNWAQVLSRTPELYLPYNYLLFHLFEGVLLTFSNVDVFGFLTSQISFNLIIPLAFYVLAKAYLGKINKKLPIISTVFFSLFSSFSWIYFVQMKMNTALVSELTLLSNVNTVAWAGAVYSLQPVLWFLPVSVSYMALILQLWLLHKSNVPRWSWIFLFTVLNLSSFMTHVSEALVLTIMLSLIGLFFRSEELRIRDALLASSLSLIIGSSLYFILQQFLVRGINSILVILPLLLALFSFVAHYGPLSNLAGKIKRIFAFRNKANVNIVLLGLLFIYILGLFCWVSLSSSINSWELLAVGIVPWFIYPLVLGIVGLLAIIGIFYVLNYETMKKELVLFVGIIILSLIIGEALSYFNANILKTDYFEKRFPFYIFLASSVIASIPILKALEYIKKNENYLIRRIGVAVLVSTVVVYGTQSMYMIVEYNNLTKSPQNWPSPKEIQALNYLGNIFDQDKYAFAIALSQRSQDALVYTAPADRLRLSRPLYTASSPEMVFIQLYRHYAYSHSYIYLDNRDMIYLNNSANQYLADYLALFPLVFDNSEVRIYNVSQSSYPQPTSEAALVIPFDKSIEKQNLAMAYDMLSQGFYNYTVAYDLDQNALNFNTVVLSFDPLEGNARSNMFQDTFNQTLPSESIIKGSWRIEDAQLMGGDNVNGEGIFLSPTIAENFTATVQVKPISGNVTVLAYASIVYSWVDSKNYRIADIYFNPNGYVYLLFRDFANGVETDYPPWPGIQTTLKWAFNDNFVVKLTVNGASNEISLNDTASLSSTLENAAGKIGLRYYRFSKISFDDFLVNYTTQINSRPINDYLNYLNTGGRIILLNTGGYGGNGFFANDLFTISNSEAAAQQIQGNSGKIDLPIELPAQLMSAKDNSTTIISNYIGADAKIPFISQKDYDNGGELLYVNVYPIIQAIQTSSNRSAFYPLLCELLNGISLTKMTPTEPLSDINGYVREISLKKNVTLETSSILFPLGLKLGEIAVTSGNSSRTFYNVTGIELSDFSRMTIETDNATIQNGDGLYTDVKLNSTFLIKSPTNSLHLNIKSGNETFTLDNANSISIILDSNVHLQVRTPTVTSFEVNFVEIYLNNYPQLTTLISGQNLNVTGYTQFSIMISDYYQAVGNLTLGSSLQSSSQATQYDFLSTLPTAVFWALLLLPVFMSIFIIFTLKKPSSKSKRVLEKTKRLPKS